MVSDYAIQTVVIPVTLPALQTFDEALLQDIRAANVDDDGLRMWWLGQSGFLVQHRGRHLLLDPYLSESLTKKYATTDKPHVRMTRRAVDPAQLDFVDVATSSHNHTDHLDAESLLPLLVANPDLEIVVPEANREFAANRLELPIDRLRTVDAGRSLEVGEFRLHGVPAAHEALETDDEGRHRFLGLVVECGHWTIYHSGDTIRYPGMDETLRRWPIDVAILPINGRLPERRVSGNLWGKEAAQLASDIAAKLTIPCHYEMFEFNTVTTEEFEAAASQLALPYRVLRCGERLALPINGD